MPADARRQRQRRPVHAGRRNFVHLSVRAFLGANGGDRATAPRTGGGGNADRADSAPGIVKERAVPAWQTPSGRQDSMK